MTSISGEYLTPPRAAIALPTLNVSQDELDLVKFHMERLTSFVAKNKVKEAYYEGSQRIKNLGISIPPQLAGVEAVVGWPGTAVDVLEERLDWQGWTSDTDLYGLDEVYDANGLDVDSSMGHLDALIAGAGFVIVGSGDAGDPNPLITVESPKNVTGAWDGRKRRLSSALSIDRMKAETVEVVTLYTPFSNITLDRSAGTWQVVDRDNHNLGRVLVAPLFNRPRASRVEGRSEISRAVRGYTDQAVRTLLGMEINREFYSAPQRWIMGADESAFVDKDGNVRTGWEAIMGRVLALPTNEDGNNPEVGQFTAASPAPYLEQVRGLSQLLAAEAAIPAPYLGFVTENPSSADAIRQAEARLIKRAERRQQGFGRTWREVAALALLVRDGRLPDNFSVGVKWRDAATPTRSAAADEAVKLIGAGVLPPDSSVTLDRIGLSPQEQRQITSDRRRSAGRSAMSALAAAAEAARSDADVISLEARRGDGG